jgi:DNA modification methylase
VKLKQAILSTMGREDFKRVLDVLHVNGVDRRSAETMSARIAGTRKASPALLLEHLSEAQVKQVCELVSLPTRGRRGALVRLLLLADGAVDKAGNGDSTSAEDTGSSAKDGVTRWARPNEVVMPERAPSLPTEPVTNTAPLRATRTEVIWPGKYDDDGHLVEPPQVSLPFQVIEVIEEGRTSREAFRQGTLPLFGAMSNGPADDGWRNKLIWGENLYVLSSLQAEFAGKIDLIYIDPPFLAGRDFKHSTIVGDGDSLVEEAKTRSIIQTKAYYDTWGRGRDSYLASMWQRLIVARSLLSERGSIYFHIGPGMNHCIRLLLDEIFGANNGMEIIWKRTTAHADSRIYGTVHDVLLFYTKSDQHIWNEQYVAHDEKYIADKYTGRDPDGRRYMLDNITSPNPRPKMMYAWKGHEPPAMGWRYSKERMAELDAEGRIWYPDSKQKRLRLKRYLDESSGVPLSSVWSDINPVNSQAREDTGYDTQKPEALLERVIKASSDPGSLVLDFFCGSGTTLAVAERLARRWIGCDLGRFALHTARKRLLEVRTEGPQGTGPKGCRPFEVLNLGRYERKYWQGITFGNEPKNDIETALAAYVRFVLDLYKAQPVQGTHVHGKKGGALVHVGAVDAPVTISQIEDAVTETKSKGVKEVHVLGWEFEMGLHDPLAQYAKARHGVTVRLVSIPREAMERRAVEAGDIQFFDLAYLELAVKSAGSGAKALRTVKAKIEDFVIPSTESIPEEVRNKVRKWADYIDYWAVDWDFRNDTFVNQWQTYRTREDRTLALETPAHTYERAGSYQILVKVVDIFGNDTSHLVRWEAK